MTEEWALTIWGVRLKVRPLTLVGIKLTQAFGTAIYRGSVFTSPWSSTCIIHPNQLPSCKFNLGTSSIGQC